MLTFDQTPFFPSGKLINFIVDLEIEIVDATILFLIQKGTSSTISMDTQGYIYVPTSCLQNKCLLHVAFHGCAQGKYKVGDVYARNSGYNQVADLNNIIILYPQAKQILTTNPNGCWDW